MKKGVYMENMSFNLILHAGNSKSFSMEGLQKAREGDFTEANKLIEQAEVELNIAHDLQTTLLVDMSKGSKVEVDVLLVHAQDHLNGAQIIIELAKELIFIYKTLKGGNLI